MPRFSWPDALGRGVLIVVYFIVATVWLPDFVLTLDAVADASDVVRDILVLVVWGSALVAGMYLLRWAQRRGWV